MGCTCTIEVDYGDGPTALWIKKRKARKPHTCCECNKEIKPGEMYEHAKLLQDREFCAYKTCAICQEIRDCYFCSWLYTNMWKDLWNELDWQDDIKLCMLDHLSPEARSVMIDYIDHFMEDRE